MDNQIKNITPVTPTTTAAPAMPTPSAPKTPSTPAVAQATAPTTGITAPSATPAAPVAKPEVKSPAIPGTEVKKDELKTDDKSAEDKPKANELDLSNATAGQGAATKEAGLTGMVTFDYNNTPITDIVNSIILDSISKGASDIHLDPFEEGIKIRIRIDGLLHDYSIVPLYVKRNLVTRIKIISGMNITESRVPQDGAIRTTIDEQPIDIRVSALPTNMGEKVVMRIMDYTMSAQGIDHIDFSDFNIKKVHRMMELPNGIILVTGATGSGKSTTVYSVLQALNTEDTNIITVEDPVEMNIEGINQVMVNSEIGLTFASVLRSILRQDPDIIMVGEIRDDETARIAVRAAITGHLVLSTIHTNNALNTIERLTDMSVERYLLGSALSGIISQKLALRLCPKCKKKRPTTEYEKEMFKKTLKEDVEEIYEPVGCDECSRGFRGRIGIHEVLLLNQKVRDAITANVSKSELREVVYGASETKTMLEDGLEKCKQGFTSFDEILKLIDLDDDLGSDTQLGLQNQLEETQMKKNKEDKKEDSKPDIEEKHEEEKKPNLDENKSDEKKEEKEEKSIEIPTFKSPTPDIKPMTSSIPSIEAPRPTAPTSTTSTPGTPNSSTAFNSKPANDLSSILSSAPSTIKSESTISSPISF